MSDTLHQDWPGRGNNGDGFIYSGVILQTDWRIFEKLYPTNINVSINHAPTNSQPEGCGYIEMCDKSHRYKGQASR